MSGGGGGPSETTVTNKNLPEYAEPYYMDMMQRVAMETSRPYEPYGGQRLQYFAPMEQEALGRYGQLGVSGTPPEMDMAAMMAMQSGERWDPGINTSAYSDYTAGNPSYFGYSPDTRDSGYWANQRNMQFDPGTLASKEAIDQYMSPYQQNVTDIEKREAQRQADIARNSIGLSAAGQGSLGGYREAIEQAENTRNTAQLVGDIQHRGSQSAYENAQQAFEADRQARAQAEQFGQSQFGMNEQTRQQMEQLYQNQFGMNQQNIQAGEQLEMQKYQAYEQARQQAAQMGLSAQEIEQAGQRAAADIRLGQQDRQLAGAGMLGDFASQRQQMEMERLDAMLRAGGMERQLLQQGLDIGYMDFLRQQGYPMEQLSMFSNILQGNAMQPGSTKQVYGREPSTMEGLLGSGIAAAGIYNMAGQGGYPRGGG